jgi:ankyrin repeat protein
MRLQYGVTPVSWAIGKGSDKIMELLVNAGADVNVVDKVGVIFTACCVCVFHGDSVF